GMTGTLAETGAIGLGSRRAQECYERRRLRRPAPANTKTRNSAPGPGAAEPRPAWQPPAMLLSFPPGGGGSPALPGGGAPTPPAGCTVIWKYTFPSGGPNQVTPSCTRPQCSVNVVVCCTSGAFRGKLKRPTGRGGWVLGAAAVGRPALIQLAGS